MVSTTTTTPCGVKLAAWLRSRPRFRTAERLSCVTGTPVGRARLQPWGSPQPGQQLDKKGHHSQDSSKTRRGKGRQALRQAPAAAFHAAPLGVQIACRSAYPLCCRSSILISLTARYRYSYPHLPGACSVFCCAKAAVVGGRYIVELCTVPLLQRFLRGKRPKAGANLGEGSTMASCRDRIAVPGHCKCHAKTDQTKTRRANQELQRVRTPPVSRENPDQDKKSKPGIPTRLVP